MCDLPEVRTKSIFDTFERNRGQPEKLEKGGGRHWGKKGVGEGEGYDEEGSGEGGKRKCGEQERDA